MFILDYSRNVEKLDRYAKYIKYSSCVSITLGLIGYGIIAFTLLSIYVFVAITGADDVWNDQYNNKLEEWNCIRF